MHEVLDASVWAPKAPADHLEQFFFQGSLQSIWWWQRLSQGSSELAWTPPLGTLAPGPAAIDGIRTWITSIPLTLPN